MAEANDARKLVLEIVVKVVVERDDANDDDDGPKLTINDLPKELLVSIFAAIDNPTWVRFTFPCVCKAWAELYRSKDASPLHETLEVDFRKEVIWAREKEEEEERKRREEAAAVATALRGAFSALSSGEKEGARPTFAPASVGASSGAGAVCV